MAIEYGIYLIQKKSIKETPNEPRATHKKKKAKNKQKPAKEKKQRKTPRPKGEGNIELIIQRMTNSPITTPEDIAQKYLEPKNRQERGYATIHTSEGEPIVKLYYGKHELMDMGGDVIPEKIAHHDLVEECSLSFTKHKRLFIQSNFRLTPNGYGNMERFALRYDLKYKTTKNQGKDLEVSDPEYPFLLKKDNHILIIQSPIKISQFQGMKMIPVKTSGQGASRLSIKPNRTSDEFNSYIYQTLLSTYNHFKEALLPRRI